MLTSTFCHIPGVGEKTERALWSAGAITWGALLSPTGQNTPLRVKQSWIPHLQESMEHFTTRDPGFFADRLPSQCQWRLYRDFQDCCAFIDIETTGLGGFDEITTIALYDRHRVRYYVNGQNLAQFVEDIQEFRLLVTYNGKCFDVPFIERYFGIRLPQAHIDLRYPLRSLGHSGGLKNCERQLGIGRTGLEDVDGFVAVLLWEEYRKRNNDKALETLLAYNIQDTVNLEVLMVHVYNHKLRDTPFSDSHRVRPQPSPKVPFQADRDTVDRVIRNAAGYQTNWAAVAGL